MNYLTAGESHGPQLTGILEGIPAGLHLDVDQINQALAARQGGYGRGNRQKKEGMDAATAKKSNMTRLRSSVASVMA